MRTSSLPAVLQQSLNEIYLLGLHRAPAEACGLLTDTPRLLADGRRTHVIELPNRTLYTSGQYVIDAADVRLAMEDHEEVGEMAVWHTHPSGHVGPSQGDADNRPALDIQLFVVALTPDGPVATWF